MRIFSLFDGISCARVALDRAGIPVEVYFASEIDKYAEQISHKNYPEIRHLGDIKEIQKDVQYSNNIKNIDLLIGGSPCQDLSIAKKDRKGLDGERSGLFWEYVRILEEVKPKYFILENVNSMSKDSKELITRAISKVAGKRIEPLMINASLVSAQNRKRLFWTNIPNVILPNDKEIFLKDILENGIGEPVALRNRGQGKKPEYNGTGKANALTTVQTDSMVDSVYQYRRTYWRETKGGKVPTLTANMGTGGNNVPYIKVKETTKKGYAIATPGMSVDLSFPNSKTRRGRVGNKAKNLMTSQTIGVFDGAGIRKLTTIECERLQCLPDNYTEGVSNTQRYKALGNAFNVDVVAHILSFIPKK